MLHCFTSVSNRVLPLNNTNMLASCHTYGVIVDGSGLKDFSHHYVNLLGHSIFALVFQTELELDSHQKFVQSYVRKSFVAEMNHKTSW